MTGEGFRSLLSPEEKEVFAAAGYGARAGFGARPVLAIVDVNYNFCGDRPEPLLESVKRWRNSCGEQAWEAAERISQLAAAARRARVPVIYSTGEDRRPDGPNSGRWADKNRRRGEDTSVHGAKGNQIMPLVAPEPGDLVIVKSKPSGFFGTQLASILVELEADSIVVCGTTTSGCVRATVVDGFSYNYRMSVVEECTFDRGRLSHLVNLFDMDQKYADVVTMAETVAYFDSLASGRRQTTEGTSQHA